MFDFFKKGGNAKTQGRTATTENTEDLRSVVYQVGLNERLEKLEAAEEGRKIAEMDARDEADKSVLKCGDSYISVREESFDRYGYRSIHCMLDELSHGKIYTLRRRGEKEPYGECRESEIKDMRAVVAFHDKLNPKPAKKTTKKKAPRKRGAK